VGAWRVDLLSAPPVRRARSGRETGCQTGKAGATPRVARGCSGPKSGLRRSASICRQPR